MESRYLASSRFGLPVPACARGESRRSGEPLLEQRGQALGEFLGECLLEWLPKLGVGAVAVGAQADGPGWRSAPRPAGRTTARARARQPPAPRRWAGRWRSEPWGGRRLRWSLGLGVLCEPSRTLTRTVESHGSVALGQRPRPAARRRPHGLRCSPPGGRAARRSAQWDRSSL